MQILIKSILAVMTAPWTTTIICIEVMKEENPKISLAVALQMLDKSQDFSSSFAKTERQCHLATITEKL